MNKINTFQKYKTLVRPDIDVNAIRESALKNERKIISHKEKGVEMKTLS